MWDRAEAALQAALETTGLPYELKPGDGAFYGPKIDFDVSDSIGRKWQLGTIQLDYAAPERFDLIYVGRGQRRAPAGRHPPRGERVVRAVHRDPDRALRRGLPGLARPGAGAGAADLATTRPRWPRRSPPAPRGRGSAPLLDASNETLNYRIRERRADEGARTWRSSASARRTPAPSRSGCAGPATSRRSCSAGGVASPGSSGRSRTPRARALRRAASAIVAPSTATRGPRVRPDHPGHRLRLPHTHRQVPRRPVLLLRAAARAPSPSARRCAGPASTPPRSTKSSWATCCRAARGRPRPPGDDPCRPSRDRSPALTINKVCGSGLKAVMLAAQAIKAGDAQASSPAGMESMSSSPHYLFGYRNGIKAGNQTIIDGMIHDGLWDSFGNTHMGGYAEYTADQVGDHPRRSRTSSRTRATARPSAAMAAGKFEAEIFAGRGGREGRPDAREDGRVAARGHHRRGPRQAQAGLPEGRDGDGRQRAGPNDGASALVVTSLAFAKAHGLTPLARITAYATGRRRAEGTVLSRRSWRCRT